MDLEYDRKFQEMKKYIPFLENMITRLEATGTLSSNPRQAQLDKIRSLRDLLLNKKKRMKMENLLKCEQVLVNLYAKVEQRDTLSGVKKSADSGFSIESPTPKEKSDLEAVRNKLKTVVKRQENVQDTLPEILPRSEINDVRTSGTKEPALFQRRPNQTNIDESQISPPGSSTKRNYTRVLISPDTSSRRWSQSQASTEKLLFSRRSPRKSPKRYSPSYHKRERKKSHSEKRKDLNITLNVPEESLQSLNTKDILSRIINCSDGDVDIDTLRELRKQILTELQKTGAKDDISDLILKSYNKNKNKSKTKKKPKVKEEIEEGELSDSESEAIESIYGSLVVKDPIQATVSSDKDIQPRKIQICLVINSDDKPETKADEIANTNVTTDFAELVMYDKESKEENKPDPDKDLKTEQEVTSPKKPSATSETDVKDAYSKKCGLDEKTNVEPTVEPTVETKSDDVRTAAEMDTTSSDNKDITTTTSKDSIQHKANFYKPLTEQSNVEAVVPLNNETNSCDQRRDSQTNTTSKLSDIENKLEQMEKSPEIPLLHDRTIEQKPPDSTLSEIDILQALKNEILSDITVPGTETTTPLLHQPKVIKVASAQEIMPKKRISIENYKQKSVTSVKLNLDQISPKDDPMKKTSLKLTEKECERFNIPKISFDEEDESLDDDDGDILATDVYSDLAPKSPDHEVFEHEEITSPVIIPPEPIKQGPVIIQKSDVDMRTLPLLSPNTAQVPAMYNNVVVSTSNDFCGDKKKLDKIEQNINQNRPTPVDPRLRRDINPNTNNQSPNPHAANIEKTPRPSMFNSNSTISTTTTMMTPNARTYQMTPTHQSFEMDQSNHNKPHVYVPTLSSYDFCEREKSVSRDSALGERRSRFDGVRESRWNSPRDDLSQNSRLTDRFNPEKRDDLYQRSEGSITPILTFGRADCPPTPSHPFGRMECPLTPSHPFGRMECPPTSSHYGRPDCPPTPSHPFGRMDCPSTPSHPFGRSDCPSTPSHPFGRSDCPSTPSHPFGRSDCPSTPSHPFGRTEGPPPLMSKPYGVVDFPTPNIIFGRNDCPPNPNHTFHESSQTPSHTFSRSDPIKNPYARSDNNTQKYPKDPRLYRKSEYECKSHYDERDSGYYKDRDRYRSSSYSSQKPYSGSDNYQNYDRDNRTSRNKKFNNTPNYKDTDRHDSPLMARDYESEDTHNKDRRHNSVARSHKEVGSRRLRPEDIQSSSRASISSRDSVEIKFGKGLEHSSVQQHNKTLSVKWNAGRSFTIDTSINSTFQKHIDRAKDILGLVNNFDSRRERATSVGRSLVRESSVERTLPQVPKPEKDSFEIKRRAFRRASSVGREMIDSDKRSFQEIKADFKSCKLPDKEFSNKIESRSNYKSKEMEESRRRSRKEIYERQKTEKRGQESSMSSYSPRKNYRDPRMRRQLESKKDRRGNDAYGRKSGIVYSNDNIVTGSIMASGYGVKNYKIPKIKRVTEEKEVAVVNTELEKKSDKEIEDKKINDKIKENLIKENTNTKEKQKSKNKNKELNETSGDLGTKTITEDSKKVCDVGKPEEFTERRQTRSSKKITIDSQTATEVFTKSKKNNKLLYDSDSDSEADRKQKELHAKETNTIDKNLAKADESKFTKSNKIGNSLVKERNVKKLDPADLDATFGIDELEMFPDNIVSDPVIDNINDLIADLDNDLGTGKNETNHNFTKEITLENMMENISSPEKNNSVIDDDTSKILDAIDNIANAKSDISPLKINKSDQTQDMSSEIVNSELFRKEPKDVQLKVINKDMNRLKDTITTIPTQSDAVQIKENENSNNLTFISAAKFNNEDIDSTTETDKNVKLADEKILLDEQNADTCSTPDSTINTEEGLLKSNNEETLPGCTNEVTSTESVDPKPSSSAKESVSGLDSLGSLLSILQDKSKIKELLNMLGGSSNENEKIKKKLEKLSEIVSDDEDSVDVPINKLEKSKVSEISSLDDPKCTIDGQEAKILQEDQLSQDSYVLNAKDPKPEEDHLSRDSNKLEDDDTKASDVDPEMPETDTETQNDEIKPRKKPVKKSRGMKKSKLKLKKSASNTAKRVTRATTAVKPKVKKIPRELMQLQEDIKEMFIRDEVLSATGIRMCRLAKLVDEKITSPPKEESVMPEAGPVVVLEKFKDTIDKKFGFEKANKKKIGPKAKVKTLTDNTRETARAKTPTIWKNKPGPKSKTKNKKDPDPYEFELDSSGDTNTEKASDDGSSSGSESESDSLASSQSFGSTELLADIKKKTKRKRRGWQAGVIKSKAKKKKVEAKQTEPISVQINEIIPEKVLNPDLNCFTDRNYCFRKNQLSYSCRLCSFFGTDIVLHYRNQHPHVEIPLSRMTPEVAKEAIEQCEEINFKAISKVPSDRYTCTFCYKEFTNSRSVLETFFWHIVSMHTGEYKQDCSKCVNVNECPFNLDIPPPPKDVKGQLIGFICKKCNFTQISLENLKTHVIVRHNDEQTAVYTINLSIMSKRSLNTLLRRSEFERTALLTSSRSSSVVAEDNNDSIRKDENEGVRTRKSARKMNQSISSPIQSKITFEGDDNISELSDVPSETSEVPVKIERIESEVAEGSNSEECPSSDNIERTSVDADRLHKQQPDLAEPQHSDDIFDYPHFKISQTMSGAKEYYCCINGNFHFKTTLLISMKKHVQLKHSENWDGYCYVCKVIVTPQGVHHFRDCLEHYLDKHMDNFPVFEKSVESTPPPSSVVNAESADKNPPISKPYINVRPLSELITKEADTESESNVSFPIIQSVVSLGTAEAEPLSLYPTVEQQVVDKIFKYEEHQAEVTSKKYYLVIQTMLVPDNLIKIFKCSGRYCSYATDSTEEALAHATTHQRIGGSEALSCCYCNFDSGGNAVDLIMHVFKNHGGCQYCCRQCFYRAASSQAVGVHITRVHNVSPSPGCVLRTTAITALPAALKEVMLTREQVVPAYVCVHNDQDGPCQFRAYTPDQFCYHLQRKHSVAEMHPCHLCSELMPSPQELVQHMKSHGLKIYQCVWCVHGADNETELLTHISSMHPDKQPQAYVRITTNKDGGNTKRVLPLAFLNKLKVPTKEIVATPTKENAVREAERSIEMEALIGPFLTDSVTPNQNIEEPIQTTEELPQDTKPPKDVELPQTNIKMAPIVPLPIPPTSIVPSPIPPTSIVPLPIPQTPETVPQVVEIPIVKREPEEKEKGKDAVSQVVVLDSDDETMSSSTQQPVIDLSEDEPAESTEPTQTSKDVKQASKIIPDHLFICPNCKQVCKSMGGLKVHIYSCIVGRPLMQCPHCDFSSNTLQKLLWHYVADHSVKNAFECGICGFQLATENYARKHMKNVHRERYNIVVTPSEKTGVAVVSVNTAKKKSVEPQKEKVTSKRTVTKTRFDPQEIDQLPINPILNHQVYCSRCEFSTKVRLNMVRHLQLHAEQQPVPQTAPVNPVPHLESNEKHFDKMVNLASSSIVHRTPDKQRPENVPAVTLLIPLEAASRFPKYVPERQRHTCGAKGCSYISVDEAMLRCHWDTLHSGTTDFLCVHCPPHQSLDTSKPLTATRVISHLKMHDATLYACSTCSYYHFKKERVEKHISDLHENARLMVVREEYNKPNSSPSTSAQNNAAPTMDLKPWQCGLCKFKSMLRPDVINHCAKIHQSKMQYKCAYCPFRTSGIENISKHQANSHAGKPEEVFYYYYREGSIPEEADGTPMWIKQRQKADSIESEVKVEDDVTRVQKVPEPVVEAPMNIDLNLVKTEALDVPSPPLAAPTMDDLCKIFGKFCDPNGIKFKCPLCSIIMDDTKDGMQSHLYEELNYRKWSCSHCSYKAFHKEGLTDHMTSEHGRQYDPVELPADLNIEKWVSAVLAHQISIIDKHKDNLAKQKIFVENVKPGPSTEVVVPQEPAGRYSDNDLDTAFGSFGSPNNSMFCCPKCGFESKEEIVMRDHLEIELNKIRWCCSNCPSNFQTYHEAQFHCKGHDGPSRPIEAIRDPAMRAAWVSNAIQKQKKYIQTVPTPSSEPPTPEKNFLDSDNSLLVVRYEERVPSPEETRIRRKRPAPESDDERLVIDEPGLKKKPDKQCPYCDYKSVYNSGLKIHILTHFNLKPYACGYCEYSCSQKRVATNHIEKVHAGKPIKIVITEIPSDGTKPSDIKETKLTCLECEKAMPESKTLTHLHNYVKPQFAKDEIVYKCCICLILNKDMVSMEEHHNSKHAGEPVKYALYKLGTDSREAYRCVYCDTKFKYLKEYRTHHLTAHEGLPFNIMSWSHASSGSNDTKKQEGPVRKRCARKSTTKLPSSVARKSTTKLPYTVPRSITEKYYSYYGTKPTPLEHYSNVTTLMSFCNMMVPFSMKQLSEHLNIEPKVIVTDINKSSD